MKALLLTLTVVAGALAVVDGQGLDARLQNQLKQLFPAATSFSPKGGTPAHFKAFAGDPKQPQSLIGYAWFTPDLVPLERGYDGPIRMLVGMNTKGVLSGVILIEHTEPYGDFSIELPSFPKQFQNKDIRDPFKVGGDIDAVSRATITVTSATRAVRNSARRVARQFLTPPQATQ